MAVLRTCSRRLPSGEISEFGRFSFLLGGIGASDYRRFCRGTILRHARTFANVFRETGSSPLHLFHDSVESRPRLRAPFPELGVQALQVVVQTLPLLFRVRPGAAECTLQAFP